MKLKGIILFFAIAVGSLSAQTVTPNEAVTVVASPRRIGMNIGDTNWFSNGNIYKNIIGQNNPTFEPLEERRIWALSSAGTTTTFTSPIAFDNYPPNYWVGANFVIIYGQSGGAEVGCTGTITSNTGPNWPGSGNVAPTFVTSACPAAFSIGDIVIVFQNRFPTLESDWEGGFNGFAAQQSGGGKLESDTTDLCATCGTQSLLMDATTGTSAIGELWDSDNANIWILMNGTYQITFNAKLVSGSPTLTVTASRSSSNGFTCGPYTLTSASSPALTSTWTQYTETCTASEVGVRTGNPSCVAGGTTTACTAIGTAQVNFSVTGGAIYLDNASIQKTSGLDPTNTSSWRDEVIADLRLLNPGEFRNWITHLNGMSVNNMTLPANQRQPSDSGTRAYTEPGGDGKFMPSAEDILVVSQLIGAEPYLEIPVTWQAADFSNFIEFLAGPSTDGGYGARRAALGQTAPWTTVFNKIHLSFCNECWNNTFDGEALPFRNNAPGGVNFNGLYYDYAHAMYIALAAMRGNPNFNSANFELVANAQTAQTFGWDFFLANAPVGGAPDSIEIQAYYYGTNNSDTSNADMWGPAYAIPWDRVTNPSDQANFNASVTDYESQHTCGATGTSTCGVNVYEWGEGTITGTATTPTQSAQDILNAGSGNVPTVAMLPLLNEQFFNLGSQNYFSFNEYANSSAFPNTNTAKLWGAIVDAGGATGNVRPAFQAMQLVNKSIIGTMYSCPVSGTFTSNYPGNANNGENVPPGMPAISNLPYIFAWCFKTGNSRSMVLVNSDFISHTVTLAGGNVPAGTVTTRQLAPSTPNLLNEAHTGSGTSTTPMATSLTSTSGAATSTVTLPPTSVTALDFSTGATVVPAAITGKVKATGKVTIP